MNVELSTDIQFEHSAKSNYSPRISKLGHLPTCKILSEDGKNQISIAVCLIAEKKRQKINYSHKSMATGDSIRVFNS